MKIIQKRESTRKINKPAPLRTSVEWFVEQVTARFCSGLRSCKNVSSLISFGVILVVVVDTIEVFFFRYIFVCSRIKEENYTFCTLLGFFFFFYFKNKENLISKKDKQQLIRSYKIRERQKRKQTNIWTYRWRSLITHWDCFFYKYFI